MRLFILVLLLSFLTIISSLNAEEDFQVPPVPTLEERVYYLEEQIKKLNGKLERLAHLSKIEATHNPEPASSSPVEDEFDAALAPGLRDQLQREKDEKEKPPTSDVKSIEETEDPTDGSLPEGDVQALYNKAQELLTKKSYQDAERAFRVLIDKYPQDPLVINSKYWLGETYYTQGNYKKASVSFADAYKSYRKLDKSSDPKAKEMRRISYAKAPEALVKLALSLIALGRKEDARATLDQLRAEFPQLAQNIKKLVAEAESKIGSESPKKTKAS